MLDFLQHYCQGHNTRSRFEIYLTELERLKKQGIVIKYPLDDKKPLLNQATKYLCFRNLDLKTKTDRQIIETCNRCRDTLKFWMYDECQKNRANPEDSFVNKKMPAIPENLEHTEHNRLFQVWLPNLQHSFFVNYLSDYYEGETKCAQWRLHLCGLYELERRGIRLINPIKDYETQRLQAIMAEWGRDLTNTCLKSPAWKDKNTYDREIDCIYCKELTREFFKECKRTKTTIQKELDKDGLAP